MRVATYNLLHGTALPEGTVDVDRLATAVRDLDADVLGIQEVDRGQARSGGTDQAAVVAAAAGARWWRFVPTVLGTPGQRGWRAADDDADDDADGAAGDAGGAGPAYGVALVSRLPVREWRVRRFAAAPGRLPLLVPGPGGRPRFVVIPDEPRAAVAAVLEAAGGPLTVVATHLSFVPGFNVWQLREIVRWTAGLPRPCLLVGDLNLPGALPAHVSRWRPLLRAATYPSWSPRVQFDHVLADGLDPTTVVAAGARRLEVSDHCAAVVDLEG
jgi:endonuclease/exonuclease/phosphatase family metal-dependent hydrolase